MKKDYFNSIEDLPIWNWWKISETGNLIYLHKDSDYTKTDYSLIELWEKINDEYFAKYGINDALINLMKLKKKWIAKKTEYHLNGNRFALTEIDIIEAQMNEEDRKPSVSNSDTIIFLEEKLGREIDPKQLSVSKYFDYINYYNK